MQRRAGALPGADRSAGNEAPRSARRMVWEGVPLTSWTRSQLIACDALHRHSESSLESIATLDLLISAQSFRERLDDLRAVEPAIFDEDVAGLLPRDRAARNE